MVVMIVFVGTNVCECMKTMMHTVYSMEIGIWGCRIGKNNAGLLLLFLSLLFSEFRFSSCQQFYIIVVLICLGSSILYLCLYLYCYIPIVLIF